MPSSGMWPVAVKRSPVRQIFSQLIACLMGLLPFVSCYEEPLPTAPSAVVSNPNTAVKPFLS
jgi:hypothetical protein